jgi:hypothetical protein
VVLRRWCGVLSCATLSPASRAIVGITERLHPATPGADPPPAKRLQLAVPTGVRLTARSFLRYVVGLREVPSGLSHLPLFLPPPVSGVVQTYLAVRGTCDRPRQGIVNRPPRDQRRRTV